MNYFIHEGQSQGGLFSYDELKTKQIQSRTPMWREGLVEWVEAPSCLNLVDCLLPFPRRSIRNLPQLPFPCQKDRFPAPVRPALRLVERWGVPG